MARRKPSPQALARRAAAIEAHRIKAARQAARRSHARDLAVARRAGEVLRGAAARRHDVTQVNPADVEVVEVGTFGGGHEPVYMTLEEAHAALREKERGGIATGLAIGLASVAVLGVGVVVCYLLLKKDAHAAPAALQGPPVVFLPAPAPPHALSRGAAARRLVSTPTRVVAYGDPADPYNNQDVLEYDDGATRAQSFTLPSLSTTGSLAVRVASAGARARMVTLYVVSPDAAYGVFAFDPGELDAPGIGTTPIGRTILLPTGAVYQPIRLAPGQSLYAKGSTTGVVVTVTIAEV